MIEEFEGNRYLIDDEILTKRAKHAFYEIFHTEQATQALEKGELENFGRLMS